MNTLKIAQVLLFGLSAATLWYLFFCIYKDHSVEIFRQKMFELRDRLFDEAADGLVGFNHPSYIVLRSTMNGFLRYGHRVTLFEVLVQNYLVRSALRRDAGVMSFSEAWALSTKNLPKEVKEKLEPYRARMTELLLVQAFLSTPFFLLFLVVGFFVMRLPSSLYGLIRKTAFRWANSMMGESLDRIESTAMAYGKS